MSELVDQHRGVLPHFQETQQIVSLTWRIAATLPSHLQKILDDMSKLQQQNDDTPAFRETRLRKYHMLCLIFDKHLGLLPSLDLNLCKPELAVLISEAFHYYNHKHYLLHAYCIMPNHLHLLIQPLAKSGDIYYKTADIIQRLKSYTSHQINNLLLRTGPVWQHEYFDRFIRNEKDYLNTVQYILNNPVKARLTDKPDGWPWSYFDNTLQ